MSFRLRCLPMARKTNTGRSDVTSVAGRTGGGVEAVEVLRAVFDLSQTLLVDGPSHISAGV